MKAAALALAWSSLLLSLRSTCGGGWGPLGRRLIPQAMPPEYRKRSDLFRKSFI
jgi:hypothetical protein